LGALVRQEFELAKSESREEVRAAARSGASFGVGAVAALLAVMFFSAALAWLLDQWLNTALSFLIVALIWMVVAAVAISVARNHMRQIQPLPQTVETLKEDAQWAKQQRT
jgi:F0F1-type ATP synthase assembly protein I